MEGLRSDSSFARHVAERLLSERFQLVDVGCWGGLDAGWRLFGERLAAVGFDCVAEEVARLAAAETNPAVSYVAGFVGVPPGHPLHGRIAGKPVCHKWPGYRLSYQRSVDLRAALAAGATPRDLETYYREQVWSQTGDGSPSGGFDTDYAAAFAMHGDQPDADADPILLTAKLAELGLTDVDFLKIDVDGPDYEILRSATDLLARPGLLGVGVEVCFYGSHDANDNTFHNIDRLMRQKGFDLFGLTVRNYSSAALPWPYLDTYPALTSGGRPVQGDAIYIRDLSSPVRRAEAGAVSDGKLAKLAAIYSLCNLPDEAAEVLMAHRARLEGILDIPAALDLLALQIQENDGTDLSYADYIAAFEAETPQFLDLYGRRNTWLNGLMETARTVPAERDEALAKLAKAETALAAAEVELARLKGSALGRLASRLSRG
jgi:hypothetical protein